MLETCSKIVQRIALFICPQTGIITLILYIIKKPILIVYWLYFVNLDLIFFRGVAGFEPTTLLPKAGALTDCATPKTLNLITLL